MKKASLMCIFNTNAVEVVKVYSTDLTQRSINSVWVPSQVDFSLFQQLNLKGYLNSTAAFHSHVEELSQTWHFQIKEKLADSWRHLPECISEWLPPSRKFIATSGEVGPKRSRGRRKCPPLRGRCLAVRAGSRRSCVSGFMDTVSANGSLTPRRGDLGRKYGGIDKYGNHIKAEVCRSNTALLLLLFFSCQCCSPFKSFRKCSKWAKWKQSAQHRESSTCVGLRSPEIRWSHSADR